MPHASTWQRILSVTYGDQKADVLIHRAQAYYDRYWPRHSSEAGRADRRLLRRRVLPGLSIYNALLEVNDDQEEVLAEVEVLFRAAFFRAMIRGIRLLNCLPNPFFIVRPVLKLMTRTEYLPGSQETVEDTVDCFAVNVYRCFTLDTLAEHNAQELTVLFCNTDDWLAEALPAIMWERTGTLARGDDCCDFRWRRVE